MNAIGIRVSPQIIYYALANEEERAFTTKVLNVPKALDTPECLAFIRTTMLTIIGQFDVQRAGIRVYEGNTQYMDRFRMNVEGVVQELLANSTVERHFTGTKKSIASRLQLTETDVKQILEGHLQIPGVNDPQWATYKLEQRESILTAFAALQL
ncbi:hypothetical protein [Brevibacillus borstelensis]|uniref:hypothetical protein n=1 Tax=Brevibacillus borstelensis TaxID=45462 RepID=UPI0004691176|nr:hypothetical protein [Brevibacillus borstelensis]MCC0567524.1 hypothetical protein [Brevibacillus borstelensis]MCM3473505.1 hypothetical protein [Brevibacillus borstelensis]MCM3561453.1 hypothetical protein [Brevibacillus borstelensis]MCM3594003.1 hypothetical protein [Brevibacillus borstelensis]MED1855129.1 hypothetical protein [Brevibacillus borstelensis]